MKVHLRTAIALAVDASELVERANGPDSAPTAFRLFAAGENVADDGSVFFTARSAKLLLEEQEARGRLYPSDFDHLSLLPDRPAEAGRASGWHRLDVRSNAQGEPELWAVDIDWCADAKAGLEEKPPRWRYFSPAFRTTKDGEVTGYTNFALCINPLTHQLPSLAAETTHGERSMKKALMAALAALAMGDCTEDEKKAHEATLAEASDDDKKEARAKLSEYLEGLGKDEGGGEEGGDDGKDKQNAEGGDPPPPAGDGKDGEKTEAKAATAMAEDLVAAKKRIEALEVEQLLTKQKDLPETVRTWCATQPLAVVKSFLKIAPKPAPARPTRPTQGEDAVAPVGLQGEELEQMNRAMGIVPKLTKTHERLADGRLVIHAIRPSDWHRIEAESAQRAQGGR